MTRINSAIPVRMLTDEHLLAEHREIKRLPNILGKAICSGSINRIPKEFVLGTGHVLFFLDKMRFTKNRYMEVYAECLRRGFDVEYYAGNWDGVPERYMNGHCITEQERLLLVNRISDRIMGSSKKMWHYEGKPVSKEECVSILSD